MLAHSVSVSVNDNEKRLKTTGKGGGTHDGVRQIGRKSTVVS